MKLNRKNPICPDIFCVSQTHNWEIRELVTGARASKPSIFRDPDGMRPSGVQSSGAEIPVQAPLYIPIEGCYSLYVRGTPTAFGAIGYFIDAAVQIFQIADGDGTGADDLSFNYGAGGPTFSVTDGLLWSDKGKWITMTFRSIASTVDWYLYIDGELADTQSVYSALNWTTPISNIYIGNRNTGFTSSAGLTTNHHMMHSRLLSASEIKSLHGNPWQIFERQILVPTFPYDPTAAAAEPTTNVLTLTDAIDLIDSIIAQKVGTHVVTLTDTVDLNDTVELLRLRERLIAGEIVLTDSVIESYVPGGAPEPVSYVLSTNKIGFVKPFE